MDSSASASPMDGRYSAPCRFVLPIRVYTYATSPLPRICESAAIGDKFSHKPPAACQQPARSSPNTFSSEIPSIHPANCQELPHTLTIHNLLPSPVLIPHSPVSQQTPNCPTLPFAHVHLSTPPGLSAVASRFTWSPSHHKKFQLNHKKREEM